MPHGRPGRRLCDAGYYFVYIECTALRRKCSNGPTNWKTCSFLYVHVDDRYEAKSDVASTTHIDNSKTSCIKATSAQLQDRILKIALDQVDPQEGPRQSRGTDLRRGLLLRVRRVHGAQAGAQKCSKKLENM